MSGDKQLESPQEQMKQNARSCGGCLLRGLLALSLIYTAWSLFDYWRSRPSDIELPLIIGSEKLTSTDILPHTLDPLIAGRNYVYCGSFQLAWNELADKFGQGGIIQLAGSPAIAEALNQRQLTHNDVPDRAYYAIADVLDANRRTAVEQLIHKRFPEATLPQLDWGSNRPIAIAYLQRELPFKTAFLKLPPAPFPTDGQYNVAWFGIGEDAGPLVADKFRDQFLVRNYAGADEFVVQLVSEATSDELLLSLFTRTGTLDESIKRVDELIESGMNDEGRIKYIQFGEPLAIPVLRLGVDKRFESLLNASGPAGSRLEPGLADARQLIQLRLDETGVRLRSGVTLGVKSEAMPDPRRFVFDRPFLLMLRKQGARRPYFAMWIENAELMEPSY